MPNPDAGRKRAQKLYPLTICRECLTRPGREHHHRNGDVFDNSPENVVVVCRGCHMRLDGRLDASTSRLGARQLAKTHCPHGHPYSPENTWFNRKGHRFCRECNRIRGRKNRLTEV